MATRVKKFNRNNINWAIQRAGLELDDLLLSFPKLNEWISEETDPTVKQLEKFTKKLHVPFGYMFSENLPEENLTFPFFRSGKDAHDKVSLNVYHTIQILKDRQLWLTEYMKESGYEALPFVGKFNLDTDYLTVVNDIRRTLELEQNWASKHPTWERTLDFLTYKIEEIGIVVTFNGVVENNTRRKIEVSECRGFVLVDKNAPFLYINSADSKAAQMFTLVHELAHIWFGESAGFDLNKMLPANDPLELMCDKIAAEFLVPGELLTKVYRDEQRINTLSRRFKVSPIVIGRRLLDLGLISKEEFFNFYNNYIDFINRKKESQGSGGNFYATAKKRISLRFASFINNAVNENKLLYRDAYKLTSLRGDTYSRFMKEQLHQS
jgi:Zn-dependent peptidase ImmA (M78 family)